MNYLVILVYALMLCISAYLVIINNKNTINLLEQSLAQNKVLLTDIENYWNQNVALILCYFGRFEMHIEGDKMKSIIDIDLYEENETIFNGNNFKIIRLDKNILILSDNLDFSDKIRNVIILKNQITSPPRH